MNGFKRKAYFYESDGKLCFFLESPSIADTIAAPFIFDGPATEQHRKEYEKEFVAWQREKEILDSVKKKVSS